MFAGTGLGIVGGAALNGVLAARGVPARHLLFNAIALAFLATAGLVALGACDRISLGGVMPLVATSTFCFGLAAPSAARGVLDPFPDSAGVAGGLLTSVQMLSGASTSSLVAVLFPHIGAFAMSGVMTACTMVAMMVLLRTLPADATC